MTVNGLFVSPLAAELADSTRVLVMGAGGGFDVFAGLPLLFALRDAGKEVHLANVSFTNLETTTATRISDVAWRVDHESESDASYFPERYLAEWLYRNGYPSVIHAFAQTGVRPLRAALESICRDLSIDTILLVDGGTDILMRGDEAGLGTPAEDMTSLAAARHLPGVKKLVSCLGFGIDAYHGVCHAQFLENVAALEQDGGFLGSHSIQLSQPGVRLFADAVRHAHDRMPKQESIVNSSIVSALEGRFGDHHTTDRTRLGHLFINPLMTMYWHFRLERIAARSLYLDMLADTDRMFEVQAIIDGFRKFTTIRSRTSIPV
jgi:hypothetical protein